MSLWSFGYRSALIREGAAVVYVCGLCRGQEASVGMEDQDSGIRPLHITSIKKAPPPHPTKILLQSPLRSSSLNYDCLSHPALHTQGLRLTSVQRFHPDRRISNSPLHLHQRSVRPHLRSYVPARTANNTRCAIQPHRRCTTCSRSIVGESCTWLLESGDGAMGRVM